MRIVVALLVVYDLFGQAPQPDGTGLRSGTLPAKWATGGPDCSVLPKFQIHEYNPDFYVLRESGCTHYEKPFLYLFFGKDRALLIDTGAGKPDTAAAVDGVVSSWLARTGKDPSSLELIVAHSHKHADHIAGDAGFLNRPRTQIVPLTVVGTQQFFSMPKWPEATGSIDLGGRVINVIPIPGHDVLSVAFYDSQTGVLLTGDSLYPGRLYVDDFAAYVKSVDRLIAFVQGKPIAHILGNHIEETNTPFRDYPIGSRYQPEEHELALSYGHLLELQKVFASMGERPVRLAERDFTVWPK